MNCSRCKKEKQIEKFTKDNEICKTCEECREIDKKCRRKKNKLIEDNKNDNAMICVGCNLEKEINEFKRGERIFRNCKSCRELNNTYNKNLINEIKEKLIETIKPDHTICRVCNKEKQNECFIEDGIVYKTCIDCLNNIRETTRIYFEKKSNDCDEFNKFCKNCKTEKQLNKFFGIYKEETSICIDCQENIKNYLDEKNSNCDYYHKFCKTCKLQKPLSKFIGVYKEETLLDGFLTYKNNIHNIDDITRKIIIEDRIILIKNNNYKQNKINRILNIEKHLVKAAKQRALKTNLQFDIDENYIKSIWQLNNRCPILNIKYWEDSNGNKSNSPSIDRIDNNKGYTKDNVRIISLKANFIKNNYTLEELERTIRGFREYYDRTGPGIIL